MTTSTTRLIRRFSEQFISDDFEIRKESGNKDLVKRASPPRKAGLERKIGNVILKTLFGKK